MDGGLDVVGVGIALWCAVAAAVSYAETVKLLGSAAEVKTGDGSVAAIGEASTGFIPPKMGGSPVVFTPPGTPSNTVPAKGDAQFEPHLDAVEFPNPSSIALVRAPNIEKKNVSGGTCLGISYLTSIYYSRVVLPVQSGENVRVFRQYEFPITTQDAEDGLLAGAGAAPFDGIEYLVRASKATAKKDFPEFAEVMWKTEDLRRRLIE